MNEVLLIDKPSGWTSFDVVAKIRSELRSRVSSDQLSVTSKMRLTKSFGIQSRHLSLVTRHQARKRLKVGHAGTLDPFATGLLIILLGDACKRAGEFLKLDKTYEFTMKLGETSTTGDPEGEITKVTSDQLPVTSEKRQTPALESHPGHESLVTENSHSDAAVPTIDEIQTVLSQFTGTITQTPPAFSAIKVGGQRAYKLAREGKPVEIPSRQVRINRLELRSYDYPHLKCVCDVSSGTYIRSLVEDIGQTLNTGAYCTELRRTRVGEFKIEDAITVEDFISRAGSKG